MCSKKQKFMFSLFPMVSDSCIKVAPHKNHVIARSDFELYGVNVTKAVICAYM